MTYSNKDNYVVFAIKEKQKPVTSEDQRFVVYNVGKSKTFIYNTINAKNCYKCLGYFEKNVIVTSLPVTEGTPFFINLCVMHF